MKYHYQVGLEKLQGKPSANEVTYFAHEINRYVTVSTRDVERLGSMIAAGTEDAYSYWCAETPSGSFHINTESNHD